MKNENYTDSLFIQMILVIFLIFAAIGVGVWAAWSSFEDEPTCPPGAFCIDIEKDFAGATATTAAATEQAGR